MHACILHKYVFNMKYTLRHLQNDTKKINQTGQMITCAHLALQHSIPVKRQSEN